MRQCKKCGKLTNLVSGVCQDCLIKKVRRRFYKERPKCRKGILSLLKENPDLTLFKLAFWYEFDKVPIVASDGIQKQARKMLQEEA